MKMTSYNVWPLSFRSRPAVTPASSKRYRSHFTNRYQSIYSRSTSNSGDNDEKCPSSNSQFINQKDNL